MKIALIVPTMDRGGAEKQVVLLAIGLRERGHDVHVVLLTRDGPRSADLRAAGVPVHLIGKRFKVDPTALFRLVKLLKRLDVDVVHTFLFAANSFGRVAAWWVRRSTTGARRPAIISSERSVDPWKQSWNFWIDRRLQSMTDAITTNSSGVIEFYVAHGIPREQFKLIANAIEPTPTNSPGVSKQEMALRLGLDPAKHWIVAVGRLWPQKRVRDLVWAAELIGTLRLDTTLLIVGDGPQRGELLRHRDAVSQRDFVEFAGERNDVAEILAHAAAFWNASEYEGQSNAIIEAMQAGVPVIASNIAGNCDLIDPNVTGWLFDVGDAAELARRTHAILDDPVMANQVAERAQKKIESSWTIEAMIGSHIDVYTTLVSRL